MTFLSSSWREISFRTKSTFSLESPGQGVGKNYRGAFRKWHHKRGNRHPVFPSQTRNPRSLEWNTGPWVKWRWTWNYFSYAGVTVLALLLITVLKANLAPPDRYKHLKRAEEVAMTRLRIGHCKATKGRIVSRGPPAVCHHCGSTLSREHILLECGTVQELRGEFYEADSLTSLFECVRPLAIIEYLKEAAFFYLIWQVYECEIRNVKSHKPQNPDYHIIEEDKWIAENIRKMCRTANMSWRTCVVVKQTQSHSHSHWQMGFAEFLTIFLIVWR